MIERHRSAALLAAAALSSTACRFEPSTPELHYSLNRPELDKNADLAADPGAQAQLEGALELMFGTPASPRFLALPEWLEDGFDPNYWGEDHVKADEGAWAELVASNRSAYARQIAAIRAGDFAAVERPRFADDLWRWWQELADEIAEKGPEETASDDQGGTLRDQGVRLFEGYYPTLATSAAFYRNQCYHCHGTEGGGNGSTADFLNPRPRDYRPGKFKFTALKGKARPRHEDLFRTLVEGVYTTAMPSFRRFTDAQLHGLVDYVRLLAIRGETEILLASFYSPDDGLNFANVEENFTDVVARWRAAGENLIAFEGKVPEVTEERIAHGRALFTTPGEKGGANCVSCHGPTGRGDGPSVWEPGKEGKEYAKDDWGHPIQPRDLSRGVFRFGRRPIDLYRRIYAGINGTPMPEHFGMTITENGAQRTMTEDDLWDIVFYVRSLASHAPVAHGGGGHGGGAHEGESGGGASSHGKGAR
jgi:mono/diheme cytochrome c family protein